MMGKSAIKMIVTIVNYYYVIKMESMQLDDTADETIEIKAGQ